MSLLLLRRARVARSPSHRAARARPSSELVDLLKAVDERQRNQGDWQVARLHGAEGEGQGRRRLRGAGLPAQPGPEVHDPVHQAQGVAGRATCASTRTCGSTTRRWASGSGAPSASASAAPTRAARTSTSRAWPRSTIPRTTARRSWASTRRSVMTLKGKPDIDLAFPVIKLWVDKDTKNILKRQEFALSGRLMRTSYYPKWKKVYSESKKTRRLVPGGDALLRRGREGELDADRWSRAWTCSRSRRTCSPRPGWRASREPGSLTGYGSRFGESAEGLRVAGAQAAHARSARVRIRCSARASEDPPKPEVAAQQPGPRPLPAAARRRHNHRHRGGRSGTAATT